MSVIDHFARDHLPDAADLPDMIFTLPALQYPARLNCVARLLDDWVARGHGAAPCLIGTAERLNYAEAQARVNRIANILVDQFGIAPGMRVLLRAPNSPMLAACMLAVIKAGAIAVPTMPMLRARELVYPMEKSEIALAICDIRLRDDMVGARAMVPGPVLYFGTDEFATLLAGAPVERGRPGADAPH